MTAAGKSSASVNPAERSASASISNDVLLAFLVFAFLLLFVPTVGALIGLADAVNWLERQGNAAGGVIGDLTLGATGVLGKFVDGSGSGGGSGGGGLLGGIGSAVGDAGKAVGDALPF